MNAFRIPAAGAAVLCLALLVQCSPPESALPNPPAESVRTLRRTPAPLVLHFAGDIMAHRPNFSMDDYHSKYSDVTALLAEGDVNFANLEFVIDPDRELSSYPVFNVHPEYVQAALDSGFRVFSLANNHTTDFGSEGIDASLASIRDLRTDYPQLVFSGIRDRDPADGFALEILELQGWRIGFTAVTGILNDWNGSSRVQFTFYDSERRDFLAWLSTVRADVDFLVVSYHDGIEYTTVPDARKANYMRRMAQAGADIVWGHHPHVLQPMEELTVARRDGPATALILFSAGNFISSQPWSIGPEDYARTRALTGDSALYRVLLHQNGSRPRIASVQALPITHLRTPEAAFVARRLVPLIQSGSLSPEWQKYYEQRLEFIRPLLLPPRTPHGLAP